MVECIENDHKVDSKCFICNSFIVLLRDYLNTAILGQQQHFMAGIGGQACRLHVLAACLKPDFSANVWLVAISAAAPLAAA